MTSFGTRQDNDVIDVTSKLASTRANFRDSARLGLESKDSSDSLV